MSDDQSKLVCTGCGASLEFVAGEQTLKCPFCGRIREIQNQKEELANSFDFVFPLKVDKSSLEAAVLKHLASGKYTSDDLLKEATFSRVEQFYVPAYWFVGNYEAQWSASFGFDRQETYTVYVTKYQNGRSYKEPATRTRTVTDWHPYSGVEKGTFAVIASAGSRLPAEAVELVEGIHAKEAPETFDTSYTSGLEVEGFVTTESDAYRMRGVPQISEIIDGQVHRRSQGDRQQDWRIVPMYSQQKTFTLLVPVCHVTYEYQGKQYAVWTDGTDPDHLVADALPEDVRRKQSVYRGFIPLATAVAASILSLSLFNNVAVAVVIGIGVALIYGFSRRYAILNYSEKLRKSLLSQRQSETENIANLSDEERAALNADIQSPTKSFLAATEKDHIVLPMVAVLVALVIIGPGLLESLPPLNTAQHVAAVEHPTSTQRPTVSPDEANYGDNSSSQGPVPTAAQTRSENVAKCIGNDPDLVIAGCTALIQSGQETTNNLGAIYNNRGVAYHKKGLYDQAITDYNQAIGYKPDNSVAYNNRGNTYDAEGLRDQAISDYRAALNLDPQMKQAQDNLNRLGASETQATTGQASFDCGRARAPIERAICQDQTLSSLDGKTGSILAKLKSSLEPQKWSSLLTNQRQWLISRNVSCSIPLAIPLAGTYFSANSQQISCLQKIYQDRIEELGRFAQGTGASPEAQYWYYCDNPQGYYPNVSTCSSSWQKVPAQP